MHRYIAMYNANSDVWNIHFFLQIIQAGNTGITMHFDQSDGSDANSWVWSDLLIKQGHVSSVAVWVLLVYFAKKKSTSLWYGSGTGLVLGGSGK